VQTFLPYPDFTRSAAVLDDRRLGKQRVEVLQILRALHLPDYGWRTHPAVTMWRGCTDALVSYGFAVLEAWVVRGHADTTAAQIAEFAHPMRPRSQRVLEQAGELPPWLGWPDLHRSHRSALLRKDPDRYGPRFEPGLPDELPYAWPDPPAADQGAGRWSAWVLRGAVEDGDGGARVVVPALPGEEPDVLASVRRRTKRVRQVLRLVGELEVGQPVVVPTAGGRLRVGAVRDRYRREDGRDAPRHVVPVRLDREIDRADLRFPAALQDPQVVFPLHEEPLLERVLAG
jgi:hypothetical protein